jgi:hypothetical protein
MEATILAYLAGVIDSDGYISTTRGEHSGVMYSGAKVGISGTRRQPHDLAASLFGGKVYRYEPKNPRYRTQYQWTRSGMAAATVIEAVLPYLRIKREQARLALHLQEQVLLGTWLWPWDLADSIAEIHTEVRMLNQSRRHVASP